MIELCQADPEIRAIPLTSEEEGIGLAAGAWLGGQRAALLMQSSGVGNCIVDGKRPLARREFADRFTSVEAIDQPGVRVIANPGSANEAFARAHFTRATVIIHHDNASVFDELVAGRADVMVTDGLEADHQARVHPELCAVPVAAQWTRLEKAYMFAPDPAMKAYIDAWLSAAFESGRWQRALDRAMSAHR